MPAQAIAHLHKMGLIHGDLKPLNILRAALGNRAIRLIDLDAAAKIAKNMAGAKVSQRARQYLRNFSYIVCDML